MNEDFYLTLDEREKRKDLFRKVIEVLYLGEYGSLLGDLRKRLDEKPMYCGLRGRLKSDIAIVEELARGLIDRSLYDNLYKRGRFEGFMIV